jgi:hypothetical protein
LRISVRHVSRFVALFELQPLERELDVLRDRRRPAIFAACVADLVIGEPGAVPPCLRPRVATDQPKRRW